MTIFRALLRCYPPRFRRAHGDEFLQFVRLELTRGISPATLARDATAGVIREWIDVARLPPGEPMRNLFRDFRYAARLLLRSPGFTLAAILTLALGIGANAAMFTLADATLLRPVQVVNPQELVVWSWTSSYPDYTVYAGRADLFEGVLAYTRASRMNLAARGQAEIAPGAFVSGNAFEVLGVRAARGRLITPADDVPNTGIVGVLGYDYWRSRFGGDLSVVGSTVRVNNRPVTIVGVAEKGFRGLSLSGNPALYLPTASAGPIRTGFMSRANPLTSRGFVWLTVIARLRPGVTIGQANAAIDTMYAQLSGPAAPGRTRERMNLTPLPAQALGGGGAAVRSFVALLVGVVAITLLIGCANLANLVLARAATRRREMGVRLALGAARGRVVQQVLAESVLLSLTGGVAGLAVAAAALQLLGTYQLPGGLAIANVGLEINGTALIASFALSLVTGVLFGLAPALRASRTDVLASLREQGRAITTRTRTQSLLLGAQVALSLVLLSGALLFARSLWAALQMPLGFEARGVVSASVNLGLARKDAATARTFYAAALDRVRALPSVESAAWVSMMPTRGIMAGTLTIEGYTAAPDEDLTVYFSHAGPDFFRTMRTRLLQGREFNAADAGGPPVCVINESMAKKYWAGRNPIGGRLKPSDVPFTVVGVVEDTVGNDPREPLGPLVYLAYEQSLDGPESVALDAAHLLVRTTGDSDAALPLIREQLRALDDDVPLYDIERFDERVAVLLMPQRMGVTLFALFSALAVTLAAVGIYGVASYAAATRTREIGLRIALGASQQSVRRLVIADGARPVMFGIVIGLGLALYGSRSVTAFLYGISRFDPLTFVTVPVALAAIALAATYIPARRASRIAPVDALRE